MNEPRKRRKGRPPKIPGMKREKVTITFPPDLIDKAFSYADKTGESLSAVLERAMLAELRKTIPDFQSPAAGDERIDIHIKSSPSIELLPSTGKARAKKGERAG